MSDFSINNTNTKILDHIVHLAPPGSLRATSQQFRELGFKVIPGGTHTDGLTANALVILADGVYLELIAFTYPPWHFPPGSPERRERDAHPWASKIPGWIDYAFLGNGSLSSRISDIINERARHDHSGVTYAPEWASGRQRTDGRALRWVISAPDEQKHGRGTLPFFCGDITPRGWRVPSDPPSNMDHPCTAKGIKYILLLTESWDLLPLSRQLTSVIGALPTESESTEKQKIWNLDSVHHSHPQLILRTAITVSEREFITKVGTGIYEVAFAVDGRKEGHANTPYGRIVWTPV
ncbi:hypothetical protein H0H81_006080 [Sphagnurus paluster]|uniref:Glyoxalase-like domain-containing protein n=1 Tax=Sphagnurus paluster TaxID=117069 RepID=A0A9P7K5L9_9AGAR|nr:hypothetical protein H0H81_006080 [Sphagnurus paluster]